MRILEKGMHFSSKNARLLNWLLAQRWHLGIEHVSTKTNLKHGAHFIIVALPR